MAARLAAALDGALDGAVVAFAAWTLWYELALGARLSLWVPAAIWLVVAAAVVGLCVVRSLRALPPAGEEPGRPAPDERPPLHRPRPWLVPAVVLLVVAVVLRSTIGVLPTVVLALAILGAGVRERLRDDDRLRHDSIGDDVGPVPGLGSHLTALGVSCAFAVVASFLLRLSPDDVYYVNRSVWVAEHGVPALRDTMFGAGTFASTYGGGLPLTSVESLLGALAHLAQVRVGTMTYVVAVPVVGLMAGWASWRLARCWAPRRALVVLLVAVAFMVMSDGDVIGDWSLGRLWQGKVMAFCVLLPLIWCYLGEVAERRSRWSVWMLLMSGVAFVGLTSTAAIQALMVGGAALVAALLLRSRRLALGAVALMVAPLVSGVVTILGPAPVGGSEPEAPPVLVAFERVFGSDTTMLCLAVVGLVVGALLARGRQAVLAVTGSAAAMLTLVPGVYVAFNAVTSGGPVAWRLLLGPPVWLLVGLLASAPVPEAWRRRSAPRQMIPAGLVAAVLAVLVVAGTPLWSGGDAELTSRPVWKVDQQALRDVRALSQVHTGPGPWLLPPPEMQVLSIYTTRHAPVVPRRFYLPGLTGHGNHIASRKVLLDLFIPNKPFPLPHQVRRGLTRLDVSLVCVPTDDPTLLSTLEGLPGTPVREYADLSCRRPRA